MIKLPQINQYVIRFEINISSSVNVLCKTIQITEGKSHMCHETESFWVSPTIFLVRATFYELLQNLDQAQTVN